MVLEQVSATRDRLIDAVLWLLAAGFASSTAYFSFGNAPSAAGAFPGADKFWHAVAYFLTVICVLLAAVWRPGRGPGIWPGTRWLIAAGAVTAGGTIELAQGLTARGPELLDWVAEIVGVGMAVGLHVWLQTRSHSRVVVVRRPPVS